jgi:hypothetical protein
MNDVAMTLRPLRVLGALGAGMVAPLLLTAVIHAGSHHYRLWKAGGVWCGTMAPDGMITEAYGVETCVVPGGRVSLVGGVRGGRVRCRLVG